MGSWICNTILKLWGWKIVGDFPAHLRKYIVPVTPHTSNWDFPIGLLLRKARKTDIRFVIKSELYFWPLSIILNSLGGNPVDRRKAGSFLNSVVDLFNTSDDFILNIAPEGTRKKVKKLKSGYYYIAQKANVPLVPVIFDWGTKTLIIKEPFFLTDNEKADKAFLEKEFSGYTGRIPEYSFNIDE